MVIIGMDFFNIQILTLYCKRTTPQNTQVLLASYTVAALLLIIHSQ